MRKNRVPPRLTIVPTNTSAVKPARKLGKYGADLWARVTDEYDMSDAAGVEMLTSACQALDRAELLRAQIDSDGEVIRTRAGLKAHRRCVTSWQRAVSAAECCASSGSTLSRCVPAQAGRREARRAMPSKRRPLQRDRKLRLTPEIIAAWQSCDDRALSCALGLDPFGELSPLPSEILSRGVSPDDPPLPNSCRYGQELRQGARNAARASGGGRLAGLPRGLREKFARGCGDA